MSDMQRGTEALSTEQYQQITAYFPWQQSLWHQLFTNNIGTDHFHHALLLNGVPGMGKKFFAFYLAKALLCQTPKINPQTQECEPCASEEIKENCRSCQLFSTGNHPDLFHMSTPEGKKVIPVDDVRQLIQWSLLNSQLGAKKVIIIEPAEALNQNASNSLLKTLEEPVSNTIIILLTHKKQALMPTIRSRCQILDLAMPSYEIASNWLMSQEVKQKGIEQVRLILSLASGAPLFALTLAQNDQLDSRKAIIQKFLSVQQNDNDPIQVIEELNKLINNAHSGKATSKKKKEKTKGGLFTYNDVIFWMDSIVSDLAKLIFNCSDNRINNIDYLQDLKQLSEKLSLKKLMQLSESISKSYIELQGQVNNVLILEKLFIDWQNCKI